MPSSLQCSVEPTKSEVDLPLIDLSQFSPDIDGEELNYLRHHPGINKLREACTEWGFFRLVGHGIPADLLQDVDSVIRQLCDMPQESKQRADINNPRDGFFRKPCYDSFCFPKLSDSVQEMSDRLWPKAGNPKFCETLGAFAFHLADLSLKITKIILASLDLDVNAFYKSDFENCGAYMRINHYSENGKSLEEEVLFSHTDAPCLAILYQDNNGGLQVRSREGNWLNVKPLPYSFVVNIGDSLKAWSNGRYHSTEHRVVYKGWSDRISMEYFIYFEEDQQIWAPAELVDEDTPRRYRPFTYPQFLQGALNNLESKAEKPAEFIDRFAGV